MLKTFLLLKGKTVKKLEFRLGLSPSANEPIELQVDLEYQDPFGNDRPSVNEQIGISGSSLIEGAITGGKPGY